MNLRTLIEHLDLTLVAGDGTAELSDLTDDSRRVTPGCLFIARDTRDDRWREYAQAAVRGGAVAVIAPGEMAVDGEVSWAVGPRVDQALAGRLAARFYGEPAKKLKLIGVTGTNGKTTVATLTQYLLNAAGVKTGLLGTVAIDHGSPEGPQPAELTTPGAIDLHHHFAAMVAYDCEACAMEVSSHALDQGRVDGLEFDVAVFTNLTQDHLDYHGTMENYAAAKAKLFQSLGPNGVAVLNVNDPAWEIMCPPRPTRLHLTQLNPTYDDGAPPPRAVVYSAHLGPLTAQYSEVSFHGPGCDPQAGKVIRLPSVGRHNVSNALQAFAAASAILSAQSRVLIKALDRCPIVPGRLEPVRTEKHHHPAVLVDYAHTPDALENVLNALRPLISPEGKLIVVFGCGGDRDRTKRPIMARAACSLADVAVLTSDNPRTEDPQRIIDDAVAGVPPEDRAKLVVEIDRAEAIEQAILGASTNDTVVIAGKGHEDYQILGTTKIHFDDREHAKAALEQWVAQGKPGDGHPRALEGEPS